MQNIIYDSRVISTSDPMKIRIDETDPQYTYVWKTKPSNLESENIWQIMRINNITTSIDYAKWNTWFVHVWDYRTEYEYK